jgi:hypothetical protein
LKKKLQERGRVQQIIPGVELVATANEVESGLGDKVVQESEVEVAWYTEDVAYTDLHQAACQVAAQIIVLAFHGFLFLFLFPLPFCD